jgi:2',3'-cyclic-nucleotide 2'-phosphodiesterase (5'-nucleotidase family)
VLGVLPFGNVVATLTINGAELKTYLENGVSKMPAIDGRFAQVAGLCFDYNIEAAVGSRVSNVRRANPDGSCSATPVDLTAGSSYTLAINDFMAAGGDGYPVVTPRITTQNLMDQVLADYIAANTPISPTVQHRIHCVDPNPGSGNDCPAGSP